MRSYFSLVFVSMILLAACSVAVHGDPSPSPSPSPGISVEVIAPAALQAPAWIVSAVQDLEAIPAIGHLIIVILAIIAIASAILTPLTAILMGVEKAFNLTGLLPEINFLNQKVIPVLAYVSNFNSKLGQSQAKAVQPGANVPISS